MSEVDQHHQLLEASGVEAGHMHLPTVASPHHLPHKLQVHHAEGFRVHLLAELSTTPRREGHQPGREVEADMACVTPVEVGADSLCPKTVGCGSINRISSYASSKLQK